MKKPFSTLIISLIVSLPFVQQARAGDCVAEKLVLDFEDGFKQFAKDIKSAKGSSIDLVKEGCRKGSCALIKSPKRRGVVRLATTYRPKCDGDITVS